MMRNKFRTPTWPRGIACVFVGLMFLWAGTVVAESSLSSGVDWNPERLMMDQILLRLERATERSAAEARDFASRKALPMREGRVMIQIFDHFSDTAPDPAWLRAVGGTVRHQWSNRLEGWVAPSRLSELARSLPRGFYLARVDLGHATNEGPGVIGSDTYYAGGADGSGFKVCIIDGGFNLLPEAITVGAAPAAYTGHDYTGTGLTTGSVHGTACCETVFDHVPGAEYFLYKVSTSGDLNSAVNDAISEEVDVISHSLCWLNEGYEDNSGSSCGAAANAVNNGILFFTAAGNYQTEHWRGQFRDPDADEWHDWEGADPSNEVTVDNNSTIEVVLQWNHGGDTLTNYNLYLFDSSGVELEHSENILNIPEYLSWTNNTGSMQSCFVLVHHAGGSEVEIQLFTPDYDLNYITVGSIGAPANSTEGNVISVGAVDYPYYASPPGTTGILEDYSSIGPSNGGRIRPRMVGPTGTTTFAYGGEFGGTSCATPNAAGATLAFWSANLQLHPTAIRWLILKQAHIYRDWGEPDADNLYGLGGASLLSWHAHSMWTSKEYGNTANDPDKPFYTVEAAENGTPAGGRIVFIPGGDYPVDHLFDKRLIWLSIGDNAVIGDGE